MGTVEKSLSGAQDMNWDRRYGILMKEAGEKGASYPLFLFYLMISLKFVLDIIMVKLFTSYEWFS